MSRPQTGAERQAQSRRRAADPSLPQRPPGRPRVHPKPVVADGFHKKKRGRPPVGHVFAWSLGEYIDEESCKAYSSLTQEEKSERLKQMKRGARAEPAQSPEVNIADIADTEECAVCMEGFEVVAGAFTCSSVNCARVCATCWEQEVNSGCRCMSETCLCVCAWRPARCPLCRAAAFGEGENLCGMSTGCVLLEGHPGMCMCKVEVAGSRRVPLRP